jgi:hypothetical protein
MSYNQRQSWTTPGSVHSNFIPVPPQSLRPVSHWNFESVTPDTTHSQGWETHREEESQPHELGRGYMFSQRGEDIYQSRLPHRTHCKDEQSHTTAYGA